MERTVIAPDWVNTTAESSDSVLPTNTPLNHRGFDLLMDFRLGNLLKTTSPNGTMGDVYSLSVTMRNAVMLSLLIWYLAQTNATHRHNHGTMLWLMSNGVFGLGYVSRSALNHVRNIPAIVLLQFSAPPWLLWL